MIIYYRLRRGNVAMQDGGDYSYASKDGWVRDSRLLHKIHINGDAEEITGQEAKKLLASLYPGVKFFQ